MLGPVDPIARDRSLSGSSGGVRDGVLAGGAALRPEDVRHSLVMSAPADTFLARVARIVTMAWLSWSCAANPASTDTPPPEAAVTTPDPPSAAEDPGDTMSTLPTCTTHADCMQLDGRRVRVVGLYQRFEMGMGRGREFRGHVQIRLADGDGPLLGRHWHEESSRDAAELERFEGRRVAVVGTLAAETPPKPGEPEHAARLSIAAILSVESIELAEDDASSQDP
jgi:hypothetical protein